MIHSIVEEIVASPGVLGREI